MGRLEKQSRRRERLRLELADEGVDLEIDADDPRYDMVLDEIVRARHPPVHERKTFPYGALIYDDESFVSRLCPAEDSSKARESHLGSLLDESQLNRASVGDLESLRRMCDGRSTFLVRSPGRPAGLYELKVPAGELQIAWLRPAIIVQRTPVGAVKVFTSSRIYTSDGDEWRVKPYYRDAVNRLFWNLIEDLPRPYADTPSYSILDQLLAFCLHILSPRYIGATFVWRPAPDVSWDESRYISDVGSAPPARVYFNSSSPPPEKLATLLSMVDGACLVGPTGEIERVEAKLCCSDRAIDLLAAESGLRHTSAKRYSFDDPYSLVFVVSHDGPVTVYSDGMSVLQLRNGPTDAAAVVNRDADRVGGARTRARCPSCSRWLELERPQAFSAALGTALSCPICGRAEVLADARPGLDVWPVKPWSSAHD